MEVLDTYVENSKEKLYGGAQYYRLQREFEAGTYLFLPLHFFRDFLMKLTWFRLQVIRSIEFPATTQSEVATAFGLDEMKPNPDFDWYIPFLPLPLSPNNIANKHNAFRAACDITQHKIAKLYNPFLLIFCNRLKHVMKRLFLIVAANVDDKDFPEHHSMFFEEIKQMYENFVDMNVEKLYIDLQNVLEQISGYIVEGGVEVASIEDEE